MTRTPINCPTGEDRPHHMSACPLVYMGREWNRFDGCRWPNRDLLEICQGASRLGLPNSLQADLRTRLNWIEASTIPTGWDGTVVKYPFHLQEEIVGVSLFAARRKGRHFPTIHLLGTAASTPPPVVVPSCWRREDGMESPTCIRSIFSFNPLGIVKGKLKHTINRRGWKRSN